MFWEINMNGRLRNISQLRKQLTWQTGTKVHKPQITRREQNIQENENLGKIIINILAEARRIGSCEKVTFGKHNNSIMIAGLKFQQKWNTQKPNGSSGRAQAAMTAWLDHSLWYLWCFYLVVIPLGTEKAGMNLAACGREDWDLKIQHVNIHLITLTSQ